jgi:hypothetical protein
VLSDAICHYLYLVCAYFSTRFNAEKQFVLAQNRFMKACLVRHGIAYLVLEPEDKRELLRLGALTLFVVSQFHLTHSTYYAGHSSVCTRL